MKNSIDLKPKDMVLFLLWKSVYKKAVCIGPNISLLETVCISASWMTKWVHTYEECMVVNTYYTTLLDYFLNPMQKERCYKVDCCLSLCGTVSLKQMNRFRCFFIWTQVF